MEIGESVVFMNDVEGIQAGRRGRVMGLCDDTVMVGCRLRERSQYVLVQPGTCCQNRCGDGS